MMRQAGIFIPFSDLEQYPDLKGALVAYLAAQVGVTLQGSAAAPHPDEEGLAQLSVREANSFLNNCGEKTVKVLAFAIAQNGEFLLSQLQRHMRVKDLRGVWTGLTRRVRNVTGDDEARLLSWTYKPATEDWRIVMASRTVDSFRTALRERA